MLGSAEPQPVIAARGIRGIRERPVQDLTYVMLLHAAYAKGPYNTSIYTHTYKHTQTHASIYIHIHIYCIYIPLELKNVSAHVLAQNNSVLQTRKARTRLLYVHTHTYKHTHTRL